MDPWGYVDKEGGQYAVVGRGSSTQYLPSPGFIRGSFQGGYLGGKELDQSRDIARMFYVWKRC